MRLVKVDKTGYKQNLTAIVAISLFFVTSCAHNETRQNLTKGASHDVALKQADASSSVTVSQIGSREQVLSAPQIQSRADDAAQLTVEQLRTFVDRCLPNNQLPPPAGLDCSEINLRMRNLSRNDDTIAEALVTLGQLSRVDNLGRAIDDLNDGSSGRTLTGGAIAGGLVNGQINDGGEGNPLPTDTTPSLEQFLQENGLSLDQGVISRFPQ